MRLGAECFASMPLQRLRNQPAGKQAIQQFFERSAKKG